jgi:hypothetical protein
MIKIAVGFFDRLPIMVVGKAMDDEGSDLTEYVSRNITGPLCGQRAGQPVLSTFLRGGAEAVELNARVVVINGAAEKLVSLVKEYDHWLLPDCPLPRAFKKEPVYDIQKNFVRMVLEADVLERNAEDVFVL